MFPGQVIDGGWVSLMVTGKEHSALFPTASVAVQVTSVSPFGNSEPDGGTQLTVAPGQLSVAVAAKLTLTAPHWPGSVLLTMFAGQRTVGGCVSLIVTLKLQFVLLPEVSVAVQLTVVKPLAKVD